MRKHLVNDPEEIVSEALEGLALAHPQYLHFDPENRFIRRKNLTPGKVGVISGGGSGHEPMHAGLVGQGMLDVAVAGAVFASPNALQILNGTLAADTGAGVLQIVKNYTGDVLNFRIAGEFADDENVATEIVLVDDDLATDSQDGPGRRGTGSTVLIEKLLGAAAERGDSLTDLAAYGKTLVDQTRSMSLALAAGTHPGQKEPQFELANNEVEFGVGIHGERGIDVITHEQADRLVEELAKPLVESLGLKRGDSVLALTNGLGGTYPLEIQLANRALHYFLKGEGITVERNLAGSYVTSLNMHGISISLMPTDEQIVQLWDAPVKTPAITW